MYTYFAYKTLIHTHFKSQFSNDGIFQHHAVHGKSPAHSPNKHPGNCTSMLHPLNLGIIVLRPSAGKTASGKTQLKFSVSRQQHGIQSSLPVVSAKLDLIANFSMATCIVCYHEKDYY